MKKNTIKITYFLAALFFLLSSVAKAQSPNPTIRMKADPTDPQSVIVYIDWQNLSTETDAYINSIAICLWASSGAGTPTLTTIHANSAGWSNDAYHNEATVDGAIGAANNPDNLEFRRYRTTTLMSFGDVSAAGTETELFKLTFPTGNSSHVVRLLEGNNGTGGTAMDNMWSPSFKPVNEYSENGNSSYTPHDGIQSSPTLPLPVDLIDFEVLALENHDAQLTWATTSEFQNSHFDIQRSFDGYRFTTIGQVAGNGTSHALIQYTYVDETIPAHENKAFYRLHQVDFDGKSENSDVRLVQFNSSRMETITAYPNPTHDETTLLLSNEVNQGTYTITDLVGKQWAADIIKAGSRSVKMDFSHLPAGAYMATLQTDGIQKHVRIVKY